MIRKLVVTLSLLVATVAPPAAAQAQTLPDVATAVANVQGFYNRTSTFSADFQQQYLAHAYNTTKQSSGHVIFSKPGKMDWEYTDPAGQRIVSDGSTLRVYQPAEKQMYEQTVNQSQYPAALGFLTGQGSLAANFDFTILPGAQLQFTNGYVLVGTPKQPTNAYTKVLFYVDQGTSQVLRVLILDGQQNRNRFDFSNAQANAAVDATKFTFNPPAGTTIVKP
ncbi:MAG TPA: outer membrane lipoprotein chaperone LolA [Polyangiaceae bacterium]|jgi:outer membrane lipoprotein carrier protein|nr:outer membrane lipoprotein chaperone LolA [Polyangiaceae bacterium]